MAWNPKIVMFFLWDDHGLLFLTTRKKQNWKKTFKISVMQFCLENNQKKTLKKQKFPKFDKIKGKINGQKRWKLFKTRLGNHQMCSVALKTGDKKFSSCDIDFFQAKVIGAWTSVFGFTASPTENPSTNVVWGISGIFVIFLKF